MINNPTELSACVIWLDGSNSTYLKSLSTGSGDVTNGSAVGYWQNLGSLGSVGHFTNIGGGDTTRPTYISSLSCLRFNNAQYLTLSATQNYTASTVFVVTSPSIYGDQDRIYSHAASGVADNNTYLPLVQSGTSTVGSYTGGGGVNLRSSTSHRALSSFDVFTLMHTGTGITNFRNGESSAAFAHALGTLTPVRHRIGAAISITGAASNFYSGDISEVIVYNRALTNNERADVEYYLSRKWNFLNSIPRQVYGIKNGLWSLTDTWSVSAEPSPWNFPLSADNVYTNNFTVTANSSTRVDTIRNAALVPNISSGGSFVLANGVSLSAIPWTGGVLTLAEAASAEVVANFNINSTLLGNSNPAIRNYTTSGFLKIIGDISLGIAVPANSFYVELSSSGRIDYFGNIRMSNSVNNNNINAIVHSGSGTLNVFGTLYGNTSQAGNNVGMPCVRHRGNGKTDVVGNLYGGNYSGGPLYIGFAFAGPNASGSVSVSGDVFAPPVGGTGAIQNDGGSAVLLSLTGSLFATNTSPAISYNTGTSNLSVYGNIINAPNGRQAIYAPRYQVFPTGSAQYTRQASNGYDSYVDYWTSDATFSYPVSSNVLLNTLYNNNALTGSMVLPPPSSVYLNVPLGTSSLTVSAIQTGTQYRITSPGNTNFRLIGAPNNNRGTTFTATGPGTGTGLVTVIGTAFLTPESLWGTPVNSITNQQGNTGLLLKNILTYQTLTAYRTGTSFNQAQNVSLFSFADYWSDNLVWDDNVFIGDNLGPNSLSGLQLWLDAADSSTLFDATVGGNLVAADGAAVARWEDKSGYNRHVIQTIVNARPLLKTNVQNNQNIVRFDGSDDRLTGTTIPLPSPIGSTGFYVFKRATSSVGDFLTPFEIANLQRIILSTTGTSVSNGVNFIGWSDLSTNLIAPTQGYVVNTNAYFMISLTYNGGTASNKNNYNLKFNKTPVVVVQNGGSSGLSRVSSVSIGARGNSTQFIGCDVAEVILYNSVLFAPDIQRIEDYLSSKWGI